MSRSLSRNVLREEAKKLYKEKAKDVPKKNRIPFKKFFKQYKEAKMIKSSDDVVEEKEDFNFEDLVNVNEISDDELEENDNVEE